MNIEQYVTETEALVNKHYNEVKTNVERMREEARELHFKFCEKSPGTKGGEECADSYDAMVTRLVAVAMMQDHELQLHEGNEEECKNNCDGSLN